ncbi:EpsI family protein [candidate division KSB3 bacterium]|uniref:EpsI family protein n=1 Tax=candidate division KSB3 bacterium TaxID=2044937 RepID=A0A9D5Q4W7_9BACT|nr:EpsI family protein [candidate division KSB3 bacterium]MBD3323341.1 EpsI family protein [candidate division KSB3 bacterium]
MTKRFGKHFYLTAGLLIIAILLSQRIPHGKSMPLQQDLLTFGEQIGSWKGGPHRPFEPKILDVLRVDEYLNRTYLQEGNDIWISLYIGYFQDQITGQTIHSPRNCMPGSGWNFTQIRPVTLTTEGDPPLQIHALRSVLVSGNTRLLTYYWYHSRGRFITNEYWHKIYLVLDAIRYNRTDGALVRVLAPLPEEGSFEEIEAQVQAFIVQFTPQLHYEYFPPPVG